ncbi:hypothetical protein Tco_0502403 [Tanacetum coccineum]
MRHEFVGISCDYDCDIHYHLGKENIVADAFSRKERSKPLRVRSLVMTIGLNLSKQILEAQIEALKPKNLTAEDVGGLVTVLWRLKDSSHARVLIGHMNLESIISTCKIRENEGKSLLLEERLILLMVKAADLEIRMHGDK